MLIDFSADPHKAYGLMASAIAPRPIAWVSSRSKDGIVNLAPFSFFQMVTGTPPTLMISPLLQSDGSLKDTTRNIIETGEFVVNLVSYDLREKMNETSFSFPAHVSEIEQSGIATLAAERVQPPRVAGVPVSFECRVASVLPYPADKPSCHIILGEVLIAHIDDRVLDEQGHIDPRRLDLISRMGGDWYGRINSNDNFQMARPQGWNQPSTMPASALSPAVTGELAAASDGKTASAEAAKTAMADPTILAGMQQALAHHQAGRLSQAESLYRQILATQPRHADALHYLGMLMHRGGRQQEAIDLIRQAIDIDSGNALYPYNLGTIYRQSGDLVASVASYRQAIALKENFTDAHYKLGISYQQAKQLAEAEASYRQTIALASDHAGAYNNLGSVLHAMARFAEAEASYQQALRIKPDFADAYLNFGNLLKDGGKLQDAERHYRKALVLQPAYFMAHSNLALALEMQQRFEEADRGHYRALKLQPDSVEVLDHLGFSLIARHRFAEAEQCLRRLVQLQPESAERHNNLAIVLGEQQKLIEAEFFFRSAVSITPEFAHAYNNLGNVLKDQWRFDEALAAYVAALSVDPQFAMPYNNLGALSRALGKPFDSEKWLRRALLIEPDAVFALYNFSLALFDQGRRADSRASCLRVLTLNPNDEQARLQHAFLLLQNAEFKEGWREFEYRLQDEIVVREVALFAPRWDGRVDIAGKTILLYAEKGYGDSLQMCRYAKLVTARGATVVVAVPETLCTLLARSPDISACYSNLRDLPTRIDYQISLMSLPLAFGTELDTIPSDVPYLHSDSQLTHRWRAQIGATGDTDDISGKQGLRVGLVWSGEPRKHHQHAYLVDRQRSMAFEKMGPLLEIDGIEFFSLQLGEEAQAQLGKHPKVRDFTSLIDSMDDTAALIENLDLVISVDTSVAHLTGALGKPVWMLNRFNSCWRWMLDRNDSPWYPTMRIFRQPRFGDWESVIGDVAQALREWVAAASGEVKVELEIEEASKAERESVVTGPDPAIMAGMQQALAHHQAGRLPQAESLYRQILATQPRHADALHYLGMLAHQSGRQGEAVDLIQQAIDIDRANALYPYNLGAIYRQSGDLAASIASYRQAIALKDNLTDAHYKLGISYQQIGQLGEAEASYRRTIALSSEHAGAYNNLGSVLHGMGRHAESEVCYRQALRIKPQFADACLNFGNLLKELGKLRDAEMHYRLAVDLQPNDARGHSNLGVLLMRQERYEEAEQSYRQALALQPNSVEIYSNLGFSMMEQHRFADAEQYFRGALRLQPEFAEAHNNLGMALQELDKLVESETAFCKAIELRPTLVVAYNNLGNLLRECGRLDDAEASYLNALRIDPNHDGVRMNYAFVLLQRGDFLRGWVEYESRWTSNGLQPFHDFEQPLWDGISDLHGKAILIRAEQGFGDTLQFVRYATLLQRRGAIVYALVPGPLKSLVATCDAVSMVFTTSDTLPSFDYYCPMMSLPRVLKTEVASIPAQVPYFKPGGIGIERWRKLLGKKMALRVGLVWAGSPRKALSGARLIDRRRSMHFDTIKPLLKVQGVQFVNLQLGEDARAQVDAQAPLLDITNELRDFEETAALIMNLDLVISVDTAVAHLAGALGKPVWMLNRYNTCWRWFSDRDDSPWYPSMRLFRQTRRGDWQSVIADVRIALEQLVATASVVAPQAQVKRKKKH